LDQAGIIHIFLHCYLAEVFKGVSLGLCSACFLSDDSAAFYEAMEIFLFFVDFCSEFTASCLNIQLSLISAFARIRRQLSKLRPFLLGKSHFRQTFSSWGFDVKGRAIVGYYFSGIFEKAFICASESSGVGALKTVQ
jgi:hypothetical protein